MLHIRMRKNQGKVAYSKMNTYECILYRGEQDVPMHLSEIGYRQEQVMVNECTVLCQECRIGEGVRSTWHRSCLPPKVFNIQDLLTSSMVQHPSCTGGWGILTHPIYRPCKSDYTLETACWTSCHKTFAHPLYWYNSLVHAQALMYNEIETQD